MINKNKCIVKLLVKATKRRFIGIILRFLKQLFNVSKNEKIAN